MSNGSFDLQRLKTILELEKELRMLRAYQKLSDLIPGRDAEVSEALAPFAKILYEPPFPVFPHKDPTPQPGRVLEMVVTARQICHRNLEYLDSLEAKLRQAD
jgi:hypothetical protein